MAIPELGASCPDGNEGLAFLPELAVGRLLETPQEIVKTLTTFIGQGGILDLAALEAPGHKVLVTGYDFLLDSADQIAEAFER